jgi:adenylate cyclase
MKTNFRLQKKVRTVLIIALCWTLFSALSFINEYFFVADLITWKKLSGSYDFWSDFIGFTVLGVFGGLLGGYLLVFRMGSRYRRRSFAFGIINSGLLFIVFYLGFVVIGLFSMNLLFFSFKTGVGPAAQRAWENLLVNLNTPSFFVTMCVWAFVVSSTQFMLQVSDKFGPGILWKFITGKYHHPREEERIFMFLDLKSSTTIAEKIGSKRFFDLLKEIYSDITEPIINSHGEIYQYVGDEVVVTWPVEKGLEGNNCLLCFLRIEGTLEERKEHYLEEYGIAPAFKAGLHLGEATVGEIGIIKKDIVFSGDVLNTTSRIQGECNNYNVNILFSSVLLHRMPMNGEYEKIPLGEIRLRGKEEMVALSTVRIR